MLVVTGGFSKNKCMSPPPPQRTIRICAAREVRDGFRADLIWKMVFILLAEKSGREYGFCKKSGCAPKFFLKICLDISAVGRHFTDFRI